ncbi:MAG: fatty acid desaturase family protein [Gemmatimonas sp.]
MSRFADRPGSAALLAYSPWDAVPVVLGLLHFVGVVALVLSAPHLSWPAFLGFAALYSLSIAWSINSISHNLIHNPYFSSDLLNHLFSMLLSLTLGFSQVMYHYVHMRHHSGNMDRPDAKGDTVDLISIYKHGRDGQPENAFRYFLMSYFRDDPFPIYRAIKARQPREARWAIAELVVVVGFYVALAVWDWRAVLMLVPFYWLGHSLSAVNGYYEHYKANPDQPIAWGVSSYNKLYNWTWMNNGYHAEHHYRPKCHWTKMHELHLQIADEQKRAGVRVIAWPHVLGFMAAN